MDKLGWNVTPTKEWYYGPLVIVITTIAVFLGPACKSHGGVYFLYDLKKYRDFFRSTTSIPSPSLIAAIGKWFRDKSRGIASKWWGITSVRQEWQILSFYPITREHTSHTSKSSDSNEKIMKIIVVNIIDRYHIKKTHRKSRHIQYQTHKSIGNEKICDRTLEQIATQWCCMRWHDFTIPYKMDYPG